jgi:hypothetical protein
MSDMDVDNDKENFIPNFRSQKYDGLIQDLNEINDLVSISSDSVNDSDKSDGEEIDLKRKSAISLVPIFNVFYRRDERAR